MAAELQVDEESKPWFVRLGAWVEERTHLRDAILPIIQHPVPKQVNWWYVLGSATLVSFIVQVITGVVLAMQYVPDTQDVYEVLTWISARGTFGSVVRGMHFWGANAMIFLIGMHVIRVFLFGSYKYPRELNWMTGVVLLGLTFAMGFSGQLLRWDQDAYWAVVVGAEQAGKTPLIGEWLVRVMLAGEHVSGSTLSRFFATHVFLIPALIFLFIGIHLYLVILDGISEPPKAGKPVDPKTYKSEYHALLRKEGVPFFPDVAWKDAVVGVAIVGLVLLLAIVIGPRPLGDQADPTNILTYPRPDWYLLWYFAILALMPPATENYLILGIPALTFLLLFATPFISNHGERHPLRRPWAMGLVFGIVMLVSSLTVIAYSAPWSPKIEAADVIPIPADIQRRLTTDSQIVGARMFQEKGCHTCHALEGEGGARGPDLTTIADRYSRDQMIARIENGAHNMPAYGGNITNDELHNLLDFLETLHSPSQQTANAGR